MSFTKCFARQPRAWIVAEVAACMGMIAMLDLITSYKIRLLPLYAVPIFVLAWFCGTKWGVAGAVFSGVIWRAVNWCNGDPDLRSAIAAWEAPRHLGVCLLVAVVASVLRSQSRLARSR